MPAASPDSGAGHATPGIRLQEWHSRHAQCRTMGRQPAGLCKRRTPHTGPSCLCPSVSSRKSGRRHPIDSQGRHWHPDVYSWSLLEEGVRGRELPQTPRQLAEGQLWQSFSLDREGKPKGAYSIKEVLSITTDDEITYRLWGSEPGAHPHPLEKHTVLTAKRPENRRSDTSTCCLENFLKGEHFRIISIGNLRHGRGF